MVVEDLHRADDDSLDLLLLLVRSVGVAGVLLAGTQPPPGWPSLPTATTGNLARSAGVTSFAGPRDEPFSWTESASRP
jgi:hypothetical protein